MLFTMSCKSKVFLFLACILLTSHQHRFAEAARKILASPGVLSTAEGAGSSQVFADNGVVQTGGSGLTHATKHPAGGFSLSNVLANAASQSQGIVSGRVLSKTGVAQQKPGSLSASAGESQVEFFGVKNTTAQAGTANSGVATENESWNQIQGLSSASGDSIVRSGMAFKSYSEGR